MSARKGKNEAELCNVFKFGTHALAIKDGSKLRPWVPAKVKEFEDTMKAKIKRGHLLSARFRGVHVMSGFE
jgi:hypothetical protein